MYNRVTPLPGGLGYGYGFGVPWGTRYLVLQNCSILRLSWVLVL